MPYSQFVVSLTFARTTPLYIQVKDVMQAAPAAAPAADGAAPAFDIAEIKRQGLTLVHFSAHPKHCLLDVL